jgi:hypothetical protein
MDPPPTRDVQVLSLLAFMLAEVPPPVPTTPRAGQRAELFGGCIGNLTSTFRPAPTTPIPCSSLSNPPPPPHVASPLPLHTPLLRWQRGGAAAGVYGSGCGCQPWWLPIPLLPAPCSGHGGGRSGPAPHHRHRGGQHPEGIGSVAARGWYPGRCGSPGACSLHGAAAGGWGRPHGEWLAHTNAGTLAHVLRPLCTSPSCAAPCCLECGFQSVPTSRCMCCLECASRCMCMGTLSYVSVGPSPSCR